MFYVITEQKIYKGRTVKEISNSLNGKLDIDQFRQVGSDFIVNCNSADLDFIQDTKKLSSILFGNFFKKDNRAFYISIFQLILTIMLYTLLVK